MHPIELLISKADIAINQEDFETLIDIYSDDAVLVVKPGMNAVGKEQIKKAFEAIAAHFEHSLDVKQAGMAILETEILRWCWPRLLSQQRISRLQNGRPPMFSREATTIGGYARLIIPTGTVCLKQMPNHAINSDVMADVRVIMIHRERLAAQFEGDFAVFLIGSASTTH